MRLVRFDILLIFICFGSGVFIIVCVGGLF